MSKLNLKSETMVIEATILEIDYSHGSIYARTSYGFDFDAVWGGILDISNVQRARFVFDGYNYKLLSLI